MVWIPVPYAFCRKAIEDESVVVAVKYKARKKVKAAGKKVIIIVLKPRESIITVATFTGIFSSPGRAKYAVVWKN